MAPPINNYPGSAPGTVVGSPLKYRWTVTIFIGTGRSDNLNPNK